MKILNISKKLRFFLGGTFVVLGYFPVVSNVFFSQKSISNTHESFACKASVCSLDAFFAKKMQNSDVSQIINSCSKIPEVRSSLLAAADVSLKSAKKRTVVRELDHGVLAGSYYVKDKIENNFYADARNAGVPARVVDSVIKQMSGKINFRRSLKIGDSFEIVYNAKDGLQYARIITKKMNIAVYKFYQDKAAGYFFENGDGARGKILVSKGSKFAPPLAGKLRLASAYGVRIHPITKRRRKHKGADFAAPYGTPVFAVNHGKVLRSAPFSSYGNCIDIQHDEGFSSRYAHLSRLAVKVGTFVKRGQLIGYVGSTGASTGNHLHLELLKNNVNLNPLSVRMIPAKTKMDVVTDKKQFEIFKKAVLFSLAS